MHRMSSFLDSELTSRDVCFEFAVRGKANVTRTSHFVRL